MTSPRLIPIICFLLLIISPMALAQDKGIGVETVRAAEKLGTQRYALIIGINKYKDAKIPELHFSEGDAQGVYKLLTNPKTGGVEAKNATLLLGSNATERNIRKALAELSTIPRDATIFIYFSGHGAKESGDAYWVTQDAELGSLAGSAISNFDIQRYLSKVQTQRVITLLDCCYAAAMVKEQKSVVDLADVMKQFVGKGRVTITASGSGDEAIEAKDLKHSVFTYYLLEGMSGAADGVEGPADGVVSLPELTAYIDRHVADAARQRKGIQRPNIFMEEVQDPGKFLVTIDPKRIAELAAAALRESALVKSRLEALKKLAIEDRISVEQHQLGRRLLSGEALRLDEQDRQRLDYFLELVNGKLDAKHLQRLLDSIETPEQRAARLEKERVAAPVTSTLGKLEKAYRKKNGEEACRLFAELRSLSPDHPSLDVWRNRVEELAPPKELTLDLGGGVKMELVLIPAGEFMMGSPKSEKGRISVEGPQHRVRIGQPFYMSKSEVAVGQFAAFVDATGYQSDAEKGSQSFKEGKRGGYSFDESGLFGWHADVTWRSPGFSQDEDHPVVLVSWNDAKAFSLWLSNKTGRTVRLPSEAEWEYACRSGDGREFPWGGNWPPSGSAGNYGDESTKTKYLRWDTFDGYRDGYANTAAVGSFSANSFGIHDMGGNVLEWCEDWYHEDYSGSPHDGSAWLSGAREKSRILRGSSWQMSGRTSLRSASRHRYAPDDRNDYTGLRVVVSGGSASRISP